jgi:DNA-binding IclR family transcriptional regulator
MPSDLNFIDKIRFHMYYTEVAPFRQVKIMPKKHPSEPSYNAPALEKGLDILELLAGEEVGVTQQQIASGLERSTSEIFRMLSCLQRRGYIHRSSPDDLYRLSPKLFVLAHQHPPIYRLHETAMPILRQLAKRMGQSCHLGVADEGYLLVIAQADAPGFMSYTVRVGRRVKLHLTGSGMAMLAFQGEDTRDHWLELASETVGEDHRTATLRRLKTIRRRGYEQRPSQFVGGVTDISTPVLDHKGHAIAALTIPYLEKAQDSTPIELVRQAVIDAAENLSNQLGA